LTLRDRAKNCRGSALLTVMWFSAAFSMIAFSLSTTVRTELDRAALNVDSTRAYFLAQGAIEIATKRMMDVESNQGSLSMRGFTRGQRLMTLMLPGGSATVQITGDSGKFNIRNIKPEVLARLLVASGADVSRAVSIASEIDRLRRASRQGVYTSGEFLTRIPSLSLSGASFQQLEELLAVPGMTPGLFYGSFVSDRNNNLVRLEGLFHQLTMYGAGSINVNYASPATFEAAGFLPEEVDRILRMRMAHPISRQDLPNFEVSGQGFQMAFTGNESRFTLWATAQLANGHTRRTVGAKVSGALPRSPLGFRTVRWFDTPI